MERKFRLTRTTDFTRVRRSGKSYAHPLVVLMVAANPDGNTRVGITASGAVGNAVRRNRAKRRIRACMHSILPALPDGWDLVIIARKPIHEASYTSVCRAVQTLLLRARLLDQTDGSVPTSARLFE